MTDEELKNEHKKHAINCFNQAWELIEKENRTQEDIDTMIHMAHASRHHWGQIGTPLEFERGEWQISRVYAVLNRPEQALHHAKRCLEICEENEIKDFDIAFAYEGMARAYALADQKQKAVEFLELGLKAAEEIKEQADREYTLSELKSVENIL